MSARSNVANACLVQLACKKWPWNLRCSCHWWWCVCYGRLFWRSHPRGRRGVAFLSWKACAHLCKYAVSCAYFRVSDPQLLTCVGCAVMDVAFANNRFKRRHVCSDCKPRSRNWWCVSKRYRGQTSPAAPKVAVVTSMFAGVKSDSATVAHWSDHWNLLAVLRLEM